jgi:hypothetical protein
MIEIESKTEFDTVYLYANVHGFPTKSKFTDFLASF